MMMMPSKAAMLSQASASGSAAACVCVARACACVWLTCSACTAAAVCAPGASKNLTRVAGLRRLWRLEARPTLYFRVMWTNPGELSHSDRNDGNAGPDAPEGDGKCRNAMNVFPPLLNNPLLPSGGGGAALPPKVPDPKMLTR